MELVKVAAEAYVYGYPLVYGLREITGFTADASSIPVSAPYNTFGHARALLGPETTFVSPNNDTLYTIAACDVRGGSLVLHVPDTGDRYYVLQFVDAWTNNVAYVGRRATGTAEAEFLLTAPGSAHDAPGMTTIEIPGGLCIVVGRVQVDGEADLPDVHALQDQFTLAPFGAQAGEPAGVPQADSRVGEELLWWEQFRVDIRAFPPPVEDAAALEACRALGLLEPQSPYVDPEPDLAAALVEGQREGAATIERLVTADAETTNGWRSALHMFDYNLDRLGLGTIDSDEWKIADRRSAYVTRAVAARGGLWGNHGYEANYAIVAVDGDGNPLDGGHVYELRLERPPPVNAFWSLTMYDVPDYYLVANPVDRYSIGDRTPGLRYGDDGSVTITMQRESPGGNAESNWLPTPAGRFRPIMRMYDPGREVLDGDYVLPGIRRIG